MPDIADHANDREVLELETRRENSGRHQFLRRPKKESLADRISILEILARERFVYDGDRQGVSRIVFAERAALDNRHRERAEVIGTDLSILHIRNIVERLRRRAIFERKEFAPTAVGQRQRRRHAGGLNTRQRLHSFDQLLKETGRQFGTLLSILRGRK